MPLRSVDREILRLAGPAFLALVAEPMFLLADASIVGHLGTRPLAALGIAGAVISTAVGLCIFLAYGTTASVARLVGAGDRRGALAQGIDGIWLAIGIGSVVTLLGALFAGPLVTLFGADADIADPATAYLRIAFFGTIPLLVMLASTGVLRGLQDTRTPPVVAVAGNVLNLILVYGFGPVPRLGLEGSALGSVLAQIACAGALVWVVVRGARHSQASLRPDRTGITRAAHAAIPLVIRTLTLRAALLLTTYAVVVGSADDGQAVNLATHQLAFTIWTFLAFALDAIAIAAQAITGRYLGAGDAVGTREVTSRMIRWGVVSGVVVGLVLACLSPWLGRLFTDDSSVWRLLIPVLLVAAVTQPIAGVVFVLDGVLIGAGDATYLAWAGVVVLAIYAPVLLLAAHLVGGLVSVWVCFSVLFLGARWFALTRRARSEEWLVTGAGVG